jgi:hypothetical protein
MHKFIVGIINYNLEFLDILKPLDAFSHKNCVYKFIVGYINDNLEFKTFLIQMIS